MTGAGIELRFRRDGEGEPHMIWAPTEQLIHEPGIVRLVDDLSRRGSHTGPTVSIAGAPSGTYALFTRIVNEASPADITALLRHESPVVRAYMAEHVAAAMPQELSAMWTVVQDETKVYSTNGCIIRFTTVGGLARHALCQSHHTAAHALMRQIAKDGNCDLSDVIVEFARIDPQTALEVVARSLADPSLSIQARSNHLLALAFRPHSLEASLIDTSSNGAGVAMALARCSNEDSLTALTRLSSDANEHVARVARGALVINPCQSPSRRRELCSDPRIAKSADWFFLLWAGARPDDTPDLVAVLEDLLIWAPTGFSIATRVVSDNLPAVEAMTDMMRRFADLPPGHRTDALRQLADRYFANYRSKLISQLEMGPWFGQHRTLISSIHALAELGDTSAIPRIRALRRDAPPDVLGAATSALEKLGATLDP